MKKCLRNECCLIIIFNQLEGQNLKPESFEKYFIEPAGINNREIVS